LNIFHFIDSEVESDDGEWIDVEHPSDIESDPEHFVAQDKHGTVQASNEVCENGSEDNDIHDEDNDIHDEGSSEEWEECSSESGESIDSDSDNMHLQFVEDRRGSSSTEICKSDARSRRTNSDTSYSTRRIRTIKRKQLKDKDEGRKREEEMSEDTLAELQKQRKEHAAIIGQTRVSASVVWVGGWVDGWVGGWMGVCGCVHIYAHKPT